MPKLKVKSSADRFDLATFTLIVDFQDLPDESYIEELIEKAREQGAIKKSEFAVHRSYVKNFT